MTGTRRNSRAPMIVTHATATDDIENQEPAVKERNVKGRNLAVPAAIVLAGAMIAGAVVLTSRSNPLPPETDSPDGVPAAHAAAQQALDKLRPMGDEDRVRGDRNAAVVIFEYSDFECPFCKQFHATLQRVMETYGQSGDVAWVYRHFPLEVLHPVKARREAIAAECAGELGGNDAFWTYADRFFELTPSNNQTDVDKVLPQIAREMDLDGAAFKACLESGKYDARIERDIENAIATGADGTPWSILVAPDGTKFPIHGALPYASVERLIENVRKN